MKWAGCVGNHLSHSDPSILCRQREEAAAIVQPAAERSIETQSSISLSLLICQPGALLEQYIHHRQSLLPENRCYIKKSVLEFCPKYKHVALLGIIDVAIIRYAFIHVFFFLFLFSEQKAAFDHVMFTSALQHDVATF